MSQLAIDRTAERWIAGKRDDLVDSGTSGSKCGSKGDSQVAIEFHPHE